MRPSSFLWWLAQYEIANPIKLVKVVPLKIQLGLINTNIPGLPRRKPQQIRSNLEIAQITEVDQCYPQVAETLANINLLHPEYVDHLLLKTKTVLV